MLPDIKSVRIHVAIVGVGRFRDQVESGMVAIPEDTNLPYH